MKVLYFSGYGRSGSTIIGDFLGDRLNLAHLGELDRYHKLRVKPGGHYCSCGEKITVCEKWGHLHTVNESYAALIEQLLEECPDGIVDTSKRPRNLFALKRLHRQGVDVKVIILYRSWAATRSSLMTKFDVDIQKGLPKNKNYRSLFISRSNHFLRNLASVALCRVLGLQHIRVNLAELLSAQDASARQSVEAFLDVNINWSEPFTQGEHVIAGNRLRMSTEEHHLKFK